LDYVAPDFRSAALITIDTQVDTLDGEALEIPGTSAAVPQIAALATAFRNAGQPIVHIVRLYLSDGSNVDPCRRSAVEAGIEILAPGSRGTQLAPGLVERSDSFTLDPERLLAGRPQEVGEREVVIYKPRWGAFYETSLEPHLRRQDVSTLVFCGCNFPNCPRTSIYEASERDFRIVLAEDAISGLYDRGRDELQGIGVRIMPSAAIVEALERSAAASAAGSAAGSV
jgi:nicotinamidase-related amidase